MSERPRVYRTPGVVLKGTDLGETDRILTLYTPTVGKLRAVAKGVRRPGSRLGGHLDDLAFADILLARGRELDVVTQGQTLETFRRMREELWRSSYGYYVAELVDSFTAERVEDRSLFDLLVNTLRLLASEGDLTIAVRFFELHMLEMVGYRPELQHCLRCRSDIRPEVNYISVFLGGVLCPDCGRSDPSATSISLNGLKLLRYLQRLDVPPINLRPDPSSRREAETILRGYVEHLLERSVKSTAFLDRLRLEAASTEP